MAGFATDADFGPCRRKAIRLGVVVLGDTGRVALRAHEIPVLVQPGPVQDVVVFDLLIGGEMKPALAALVLRPAVPSERQRLNAPVGELDEILLQRIDAEGVLRLKDGKLAVGAVSLDQEFPSLAKEAGTHTIMLEAGIVEIAKHGLVGGMLHRGLMLRGIPQLGLRLMAACAGLAADEGCSGNGGSFGTGWRRLAIEPRLP